MIPNGGEERDGERREDSDNGIGSVSNTSDPINLTSDGLEIWRFPSGELGSWEQVVGPNGTQSIILPTGLIMPATAGFGSLCIGARGMEVYKNLLWVGTYNNVSGCQIWVTNGTHW